MILRRGVLTDLYVEDERSVVMVGESVLGLSPIATTILQAVPDEADVALEVVTAQVVAKFGPPEGPVSAKDLTRQHVWDLIAHQVLVVDDGDRDDGTPPPLDEPERTWPVAEREAAVDALRDALRHLRSDAREPWSAPASITPATFVAAAQQHHVVPYLAAHLDRLALQGQAQSALKAAAVRQQSGASALAADLATALDALRAANVRALAFKGVALAAQAYGNFSMRGAGDIDLLVAPADLGSAHQALSHAGWRPAPGFPPPGESWAWRHLARTGHELTLSGNRSEIDLHWHLVPTHGTFPAFDTLWDRRAVVSAAGHSVPTLSRYDALAHSAGHAAKDEWRWMRSLVDVHTLMADHATWVDADRPLRADQLLTVGLAASMFGIPPGAPSVVAHALREVDAVLLERVRRNQGGASAQHRPLPLPGINFMHRLRGIGLTQASWGEAGRLASTSVLPPWLTGDLTSRWALVAAPRTLFRRVKQVAGKLSR